MFELDERCLSLLNQLLEYNEYIKINELAREHHVSRRSIYYDVNKINDFLINNDIEEIVIERTKGILLADTQKSKIKHIISNNQHLMHIFTPNERLAIIICTIINRDRYFFIQDFMNLCHVSRNTIINDLKLVENKLNEYGLKLAYERSQGYRVIGESIKKRAMFFMFFHDISDYYVNGVLPTYNFKAVRTNLERLDKIEKALETKYVEGTLMSIAFILPKMKKGKEKIITPDLDVDRLMTSKEYQLVFEEFNELNNDEKIYLTLHLLGSRLQSVPLDNIYTEKDKKVYDLARSLVREFSRIACVEFSNAEEIMRNLFAHIKTSLYRYHYGIQLGNPLLDDIKIQYSELFEITKKAVEYWKQSLGVPISDSEIAYLALHFGGAMQKQHKISSLMRILIICPNGISTGNMLKGEVSSLVPHADVIDVKSLDELHKIIDNYDVVISTVKLTINKAYLLVHPILTDTDRLKIMRKCMNKEIKANIQIDALINILEPCLRIGVRDEARRILNDFFETDSLIAYSPLKIEDKVLKDFLLPEYISYFNDGQDWKTAIKKSGRSLIENGSIKSEYLEAIIKHTENYGPYMFISDKVVLAHAKIEDGALRLGLATGVFPQGVMFDQGRLANIIFVIATEDQVKHLGILKDLMRIFSNHQVVDYLLQAKNVESFIESFNDYLKRYI